MVERSGREASRSAGTWTYRAGTTTGAIEFGTVFGQDVALPPHFHDEDQVTFVLHGRRSFEIGGTRRTIEAGRGVLIAAGSVHKSLSDVAGVACLNLYLPPGEYGVAAMLAEAGEVWREANGLDHDVLLAIVDNHRIAWTPTVSRPSPSRLRVAARAAAAGLTREAFSRAFVRRYGLPPQAFERAVRLNHARRLLRRGEAPAAVAIDAGFVDQSHLGRHFKRMFGITPARFREGVRRSHLYQTRSWENPYGGGA